MTTIRLYGRGGNQILQICCVISYALKHDLEYHIPDHTVNDEVWRPFFTHLTNEKFNPDLEKVQVKEGGRPYFEIPFEESWRNKNIELDGYWQSFPYFIDYLEPIRELLAIPYLLMKQDMASLHIRRMDFLMYPRKHPVVTETYLDDAIYILRSKYKVLAEKIIVSTDDITWAKYFFNARNLKVLYAEEIMKEQYDTYNAQLNWILITQCKYHVISNSTYSYTASMFSKHDDKVVIAPHEDNWYGPDNRHIDVSMLLPKDWIRIKY